MPGAGASIALMPSLDRAPMFVGRGRGRDSFETMAEMMVHDHFRRWCAAGGRLLREKGGPAGGPAASTLRQGLRRGQRENGGGQSGPGICPVYTRRPGKTGGEIGADATGRGQTGGKGWFSVTRGGVVVTECRNTMLTI